MVLEPCTGLLEPDLPVNNGQLEPYPVWGFKDLNEGRCRGEGVLGRSRGGGGDKKNCVSIVFKTSAHTGYIESKEKTLSCLIQTGESFLRTLQNKKT